RFGRVTGAPAALLVYRIGTATDPPATWILVDLPGSQVEHVVPALQSIATELGLALYDPRGGGLLAPRPPVRALLEQEGAPPLEDPAWEAVEAALGGLRSGNSSFAILSAADGSYVQAAGNRQRLTVELHQIDGGEAFSHFVLGREPVDEEVTVIGSG